MDNENIIDTFTEMAPNYEETVNSELISFWGLGYEEFINTLLDLTPIRHELKILDIATGTCVIPIKLLEKKDCDHHIHGLDITYEMLNHAKRNLKNHNNQGAVKLTCASAMEMPYAKRSFDLAFCGLATHHMNVSLLLEEVYRVLRYGGQLSFADVGSTKLWNFPGVEWIIRLLAFVYYVFKEGPNRAWAEASAISNVRSAEQWNSLLNDLNFKNISIKKLESKYIWIPSPLVILAEKLEEENNDKTK
ncbi:class I SAM-dependent methyltransferase [Chloroflexota bacterium]